MPTIAQLVRKRRKPKRDKKPLRGFNGAPQKHGTVLKVTIVNPKKPNSASRCVARVRLSNGTEITAYIPGNGNSIQEHADLLIQGGRRPDLVGVRHKVIRGARGDNGEKGWLSHGEYIRRRNARSRYGVKKAK